MKIALILLLILLFFIVTLYAIHREKKDWNNGICPICGHELRCFDLDSGGSDGWTCDNCDYTTWVGYRKFVYKK